ncbi:hypothetical protein Tco_0536816 [Tanacetum coccineum]
MDPAITKVMWLTLSGTSIDLDDPSVTFEIAIPGKAKCGGDALSRKSGMIAGIKVEKRLFVIGTLRLAQRMMGDKLCVPEAILHFEKVLMDRSSSSPFSIHPGGSSEQDCKYDSQATILVEVDFSISRLFWQREMFQTENRKVYTEYAWSDTNGPSSSVRLFIQRHRTVDSQNVRLLTMGGHASVLCIRIMDRKLGTSTSVK